MQEKQQCAVLFTLSTDIFLMCVTVTSTLDKAICPASSERELLLVGKTDNILHNSHLDPHQEKAFYVQIKLVWHRKRKGVAQQVIDMHELCTWKNKQLLLTNAKINCILPGICHVQVVYTAAQAEVNKTGKRKQLHSGTLTEPLNVASLHDTHSSSKKQSEPWDRRSRKPLLNAALPISNLFVVLTEKRRTYAWTLHWLVFLCCSMWLCFWSTQIATYFLLLDCNFFLAQNLCLVIKELAQICCVL